MADDSMAMEQLRRRLIAAEDRASEAEAALRESDTRTRLLMESWGQAVWETDATGVVVADSPSWRAYTGQTVEEWLGYGWLDAIHPDDRLFAERQWREAMASRSLVDAEFRLRAPDGGWRWTNVRAAPVLDASGDIEKWAGLNVDIDDRKRAEVARRASEERQAFLLKLSDALRMQTSPDAIGHLALRLLADHLQADRVFLIDLKTAEDRLEIQLEWCKAALDPVVGVYRLSDFPASLRIVQEGTAVIEDCAKDQTLTEADKASIGALGVGAVIAAALRRGDKDVIFALDLVSSAPRSWTSGEVAIVEEVAERTWSAMERARAEAALRESEERQAYLLRLSDTLRPMLDASEILTAATRMLGQALDANRVFYVSIEPDGDTATVGPVYVNGVPAATGTYSLKAFAPEYVPAWRAGRSTVTADVETDPLFTAAERARYASVDTRAAIGVPLVKDGQFIALLGVNSARPRAWTDLERALVSETAERTWSALERSRAEAALRGSEARLAAAFESVPAGVAVVGTDGRSLIANDEYRRFLPSGVIPSRDEAERRSRWRAWDTEGRPVHPSDFPGARALRGERVVPGLEMLFTDDTGQEIWTSVSTVPTRDPRGELSGLVTVITDIDDLKRNAEALRASEERQAFLLKLSDTLRAETDVDAVASLAVLLLWQQMALDRCYLATYRLEDDRADITHQVGNDQLPPMPETIRLSDFPEAFQETFDKTLVVDDVRSDARFSSEDTQNMLARGFGAFLAPTLRRSPGRPLWVVVAVSARPRRWTQGEIALLEEAAERTWAAMERARNEAALRTSEERFRQFAEASAFGLWIRQADTLVMEYVSPAVPAIYGVDPEVFHGDLKQWAALIVPEERAVAMQHIERARQGELAVYEFRIQRPSDQSFRWIRNTAFPLLDGRGNVERIGGIVEDVTVAKLAVEHQSVLLAELQHRVRNIMAMIRSMVLRTADGATDVEDYRSVLEGWLMALARVQVLLTREANAGGSLRGILANELAAQAHHVDQYELEGPDIRLSPKAVEVLTLAFHELTTNALKYGALSVPEGRLHVTWAPVEKRGRSWLALDWREEGAPPRGLVMRRGFGSDLIEGRIPYELAGTGKIVIEPQGARCHLEFPLKEGESVLETDAPAASTVFGGTLDMTGAPDLSGRLVLVVEDDYYTAGDTAAALRGAGATVLGPCPSEDATLDLLETQVPTHAVLDLNLGGGGPRFAIAHELKSRSIPFVFLTGYDPEAIPADLADVPRLQKPIAFRNIVQAVAGLAP